MLRDDAIPNWLAHLAGSPIAGFLMLALGVLLVTLAWRVGAGNRRVLLCVGAFLSLAWAFNCVLIVLSHGTAAHRAEMVKQVKANHLALSSTQKIAGLMVPQGSVIQWNTDEHKQAEVYFAGPVNGLDLAGKWDLGEFTWRGRLATDGVVDGWPCASGEISFALDGRLEGCTLAGARELPGITVPAGSDYYRANNNEYSPPVMQVKIALKQKLNAPGLGIVLPKDTYVYFFENGALDYVENADPAVTVYGVELGQQATWHYVGVADAVAPAVGAEVDYVEGDLMTEMQCPGRKVPQATTVRLRRTEGVLVVKEKIDPVAGVGMRGCVVGN